MNAMNPMYHDAPKVHRDLCGLRYDNRFSFASDKPHGITTTCFNDVVLEPLATWTLLFVLLPLLAVMLKRRRSSSAHSSRLLHYRASAYRNEYKFSGKHPKWRTAFDVLYMLLVIAALLMSKLRPETNLASAYMTTSVLTTPPSCLVLAFLIRRHSSNRQTGSG